MVPNYFCFIYIFFGNFWVPKNLLVNKFCNPITILGFLTERHQTKIEEKKKKYETIDTHKEGANTHVVDVYMVPTLSLCVVPFDMIIRVTFSEQTTFIYVGCPHTV